MACTDTEQTFMVPPAHHAAATGAPLPAPMLSASPLWPPENAVSMRAVLWNILPTLQSCGKQQLWRLGPSAKESAKTCIRTSPQSSSRRSDLKSFSRHNLKLCTRMCFQSCSAAVQSLDNLVSYRLRWVCGRGASECHAHAPALHHTRKQEVSDACHVCKPLTVLLRCFRN